MSLRGGKFRIIAHLRGGDATEASLVSVESADSGAGATGSLAVMKRLKLGADAEAQTLERFADEARLCKRLDHPNLAKLLEAGQDDEGPVLVFEYLEGASLTRLRSRALRRGGGVPFGITLRIVTELARGLAYLHELKDETGKPLKLVHRDVSPESVTVTFDGAVKLTDFGMATSVASTAKSSTAKSRENRLKGNVAYMAPEQTRPELALDARADLFALGIILWELLTGKRLWEGSSEVDVIARLGDGETLPSARSINAEVPEAIDAICTQALIKVRDERFDSAADLVEALEKAATKPGLAASQADLAAFVGELFADERTKTQSVVADARAARESSRSLPAIGAPLPSDASPFVDVESEPSLRFGVAAAAEMPAKRVVEIVVVEPAGGNRFAWIVGGIVVVVLGIAGTLVATAPKEQKKIESKPYVAPTRPTATAAPTVSAPVEPQEVTIDIRVSPPEAKLFVDGVKTPNNPYHTRVVPAAFQHSIRAEAEGFEPRNMTLAFDRERSIEIALTPVPKPGMPGARPPGK